MQLIKSNNYFVVLLGLIFFTLITCTPKVQVHKIAGLSELSALKTERSTDLPTCGSWESYVPSLEYPDHLPVRTVRVNFHYMNNADSSINYRRKQAERYTKDLLFYCHEQMEKNKKMQLPLGNETPVLPTRIRYELTPSAGYEAERGIYLHNDEALYYYLHKGKKRNLGSREVYNKYGVGTDSILNIFLIPHHPDSVASPTYGKGGQQGVSLGSFVKISGMHRDKYNPWANKGNLNHEIGHMFSLIHAWRSDRCDDTPEHKNDCFSRTKNGSKCDSLFSNNIMDYNTSQNSWTPCQIARMHKRMGNFKSKARRFVREDWCNYKASAFISIKDSIHWSGSRDFSGDIIIEPGAFLEISCRVSLPPGGKIYVKKGGTLVLSKARLHNDCGKKWKGIFVEKTKKGSGEVLFRGEVEILDTEQPFLTTEINQESK